MSKLNVEIFDGKKIIFGNGTLGKIKGIESLIVCKTSDDLSELLSRLGVLNFEESKYKKVGFIKDER